MIDRLQTIAAYLALLGVIGVVIWSAIGGLRWDCERSWPVQMMPELDWRLGCVVVIDGERVPAMSLAVIR